MKRIFLLAFLLAIPITAQAAPAPSSAVEVLRQDVAAAAPLALPAHAALGIAPLLADAPAISAGPSVGSTVLDFVLAHLTVGVVLAALGFLGQRVLSAQRQRQVAIAIYYAAHMAADIDLELAPGGAKRTADKIAAYLVSADDYCRAHGWRPLKPGEQLAATAKAQAMVGAAKAAGASGSDVPALDPSKAPAAA